MHLKAEIKQQTLVVFNFNTQDTNNLACSCMDKVISNEDYANSEQIFSQFKILIEKEHNIFVEKVNEILNNNFLLIRKDLITSNFKTENLTDNILLDPEYNLQPLPSIDAAILDISENLQKYLATKQIIGIEILNESPDKDIDDLKFAIGYNYNNGEIAKETYVSTIILESELAESDFVSNNKSVSVLKTRYDNNFLMTNISSLLTGSSGAPILNKEGKILGISFGYYTDKTQYESVKNCLDLISFDKNANNEKKENYKVSKNSNLSISMNHECFNIFKNFLEKKYKSNEFYTEKNIQRPSVRKSQLAKLIESSSNIKSAKDKNVLSNSVDEAYKIKEDVTKESSNFLRKKTVRKNNCQSEKKYDSENHNQKKRKKD